MSGSTGTNLPVTITVAGVPQAEAAFNQVAASGQRAMQRVSQTTQEAHASTGRFSQAVGSAGFQLQDFAVQVQGGTSALTALSQQGSQFLGVFGTGGAIAGAVLTVGILAAGFLDLGGGIETAAEAERKFSAALAASNEIMETAAERAKRLADERTRAAIAPLEERLTQERQTLRDLNENLRAFEERAAAQREQILNRGGNPDAQQGALQGERLRLAQQAEAISTRIAELDAQRTRLLTGPTGGERDDAQSLRRELDDRLRVEEDYTNRLQRIRELRDRGAFSATEASVREAQALRQRDEALARLDRQPAARGRDAQGQPSILDRLREQSDREVAALVRSVETPLEQYQRRLEEIAAAAARAQSVGNPIPDEIIARAAERAISDLERFQRTQDAVTQKVNESDDTLRDLGITFQSAFEDAIADGEKLRRVFQALDQDIARIITRAFVTRPLSSAINSLASSVGGSIADYFQGTRSEITGVEGGQKRAVGGPVYPGQTYIVGEEQPEVFTPSVAGSVTPYGGMGGSSGGGVTQNISIDARGADAGVETRIYAALGALRQQIVADVANMASRSPSYGRAIRGPA